MDAQVLADLKGRGVDPALIAKLQAAAQAQQVPAAPPALSATQPSAQPSATQPSATQPSLPAASPRRSGRARTSRTVQVDGHTVLRSNNYDVTASHYEYAAADPAPAPASAPAAPAASAPRPAKRPRVAKVIGAGEALRLARNDRLRAEVAKNETARARFFYGHKDLLAPFSSALPALKRLALGKTLAPRVGVRVHIQPEDIGAELRDYQLQSLDWFADLHERCGALPCILGDEMVPTRRPCAFILRRPRRRASGFISATLLSHRAWAKHYKPSPT